MKMKPNDETMSNWIKYIYDKKGVNLKDHEIPKFEDLRPKLKESIIWTQWFHEFQHSGYKIFHLSISYKQKIGVDYGPENINLFFQNFWLKFFLKKIVGNNYERPGTKHLQPICVAFIDAHKKIDPNHPKARLHHHAVIAAHPDTIENIKPFLDTNRFPESSKHTNIIETYNLKEHDPMVVLYASKMIETYKDPLTFGPRSALESIGKSQTTRINHQNNQEI